MKTNKEDREDLKKESASFIEQPSMSFKARIMADIQQIKQLESFRSRPFLVACALAVVAFGVWIARVATPSEQIQDKYDQLVSYWDQLTISPVLGYSLLLLGLLLSVQLYFLLKLKRN